MNNIKKLLCVCLAFALVACGNAGSEYLGKWVNTKNANVTLEIVKNGEGFLLKETLPSKYKKNVMDTSKIPAVLKDGTLQLSGALGSFTVSHIKESDTLTMPSMGGLIEYKRVM